VKNILSQREIDAILGKARSEFAESGSGDQRIVEPCNFYHTGQMSGQFARFLTGLYEGFARSVSNSLGAYLRAHFEMVLASVELVPVREFLAGFQEAGFAAFLSLDPGGSVVAVQVDTALVFPIIDVLLGGGGNPATDSRELTEIDHEIMHGVAQILGRQLETTWQPIGVKVHIDRQLKATHFQNVYSPTEKLTVLTFEVRLNETTGAIIVSFPAPLASAMVREMSGDSHGKVCAKRQSQPGLQERMMNCRFGTAMGFPNLKVPLRDLVALQPGSVLNLRIPITTPASLVLGGREYFAAVPVRSANQRAAQLLQPYGQIAEKLE